MVHEWVVELPETELFVRPNECVLYGYRIWGPNWPYDSRWQPGTTAASCPIVITTEIVLTRISSF